MFMTKTHINKFAYISQHMSNTDSNTASTIKFPEKFPEIISDFTTDLTTTFPEYAHLWAKWTNLKSATTDAEVLETQHLFEYCLLLYPERFFDILYQTEDIFSKDSTANVFFLPDVDFRQLYHCENVSESIRKTLWKYLQLLLITIMSNVNNKSCFGDSANLFDGIDEGELQTKLTETIRGLSSFFKDILPQGGEGASADPTGLFGGGGVGAEGASDSDDDEAPDLVDGAGTDTGTGTDPKSAKPASGGRGKKSKGLFDNLPDPADLHEKLKGMFDGKIGNLAKELAEELTDDFMGILDEDDQADMKNAKNTGDVLKKLMKNPGKIMELMKTVGNKLKNKMNSGDISQEEIMKEASEMIGKMKDLGGEGTDMNDILKNLMKNMGGMGGGGKTKFNTAAMGQMSKRQAQVEKMRQRMLAKQQAMAAAAAAGSPTGILGNAAGGAPAEPLPTGYLDANVKFVLEPADNGSGNMSFKMPDEGVQEKTKINPVGQSAVAATTDTPPIDDSWLDDTPVGQSSGGGGGKKGGGGKSKKSKSKK